MRNVKRINWVDMIVPNPDETSQFYCNVFGFSREGEDEGDGHTSYHVKDGDTNVLGICDEAVFPNWVKGWLPYIDVENFDQSVAQIEASGGRIHSQMTMNYNFKGQRFCLAIDPSGAPVMICESETESED